MPVGDNRIKTGLGGWEMRSFKLSERAGCYPCGNFSDTSSLKLLKTKGSIGHAFTVCIHTENQNQVSFYPFVLHEISILIELTLGHLRYHLTDVPPQPNSQPDSVFDTDRPANGALILENEP